MRTSLAFSLFLLTVGCAGRVPPNRVALADLCQGLPIETNRHVATLLPGAGGSECVALVEVNTSPTSSEPGAWVHREGKWTFTSLSDAAGGGWQSVAVDGGVIVAIVDSVIESPGWELSVVSSSDGGRTWRELSRIRKPFYLATSGTLTMSGASGTITVELDQDYGSDVAPGSYAYHTRDGGRTWSTPLRLTAQL